MSFILLLFFLLLGICNAFSRTSITTTRRSTPFETRHFSSRLNHDGDTKSRKIGWLDSVSTLPFECTSCGKCCRTVGDVFMSPEEVIATADFLSMTTKHFIKSYAIKELPQLGAEDASSTSEQGADVVPWIVLADKVTDVGPACIFLDLETNHCQIYQARPIQCSTYPFWSNIMDTEYNWNVEVRRADDDDTSLRLPLWNADDGGCEGMKILNEENTSSGSDGVPINNALEQLMLFEEADRRTPEGMDYECD